MSSANPSELDAKRVKRTAMGGALKVPEAEATPKPTKPRNDGDAKYREG